MLHSGPYIWKAGVLGAPTRVEFAEDAISVTEKGKTTFIPLADVKSVYFFQSFSHFFHSTIIEFDATDGKNAKFFVSGYGYPTGFNADECRKAAAAFLQRMEKINPTVRIYAGAKPTLMTISLIIGTMIAIMAFVLLRDLLRTPPEKLESMLFSSGMVLLMVALILWWQVRKMMNPKLTTYDAVLAELGSSGE
ncbi:MAG: hypothetical protein R3C54_09140 [Parvularculaceae bacterium]|nr:hypothetical protein [Amphiplicatus sp.]MCB9954705.1 hypothetical protein [Caulobacterales bacterium]